MTVKQPKNLDQLIETYSDILAALLAMKYDKQITTHTEGTALLIYADDEKADAKKLLEQV